MNWFQTLSDTDSEHDSTEQTSTDDTQYIEDSSESTKYSSDGFDSDFDSYVDNNENEMRSVHNNELSERRIVDKMDYMKLNHPIEEKMETRVQLVISIYTKQKENNILINQLKQNYDQVEFDKRTNQNSNEQVQRMKDREETLVKDNDLLNGKIKQLRRDIDAFKTYE